MYIDVDNSRRCNASMTVSQAYWTICRQTNSWSVKSRTGQLAKFF